jgi:hypothetical protein
VLDYRPVRLSENPDQAVRAPLIGPFFRDMAGKEKAIDIIISRTGPQRSALAGAQQVSRRSKTGRR